MTTKKIQIPKPMTKQELKNALISLVIGILTMALMQFVNGIIQILQSWVVDVTGGTVGAVTYLIKSFRV